MSWSYLDGDNHEMKEIHRPERPVNLSQLMIEFQADKNLLEGLKLTVTSCYAREQEFICAPDYSPASDTSHNRV